jgi:hypothetical protein
MENEWITSETGTRTFRHEGWELTVFAHCSHQIDISAPNSDVEIDVTSEGISCFGEESSFYSFSGVRFTIPWRIIEEILKFKASQNDAR